MVMYFDIRLTTCDDAQSYFGFDSFRENQLETIEMLLGAQSIILCAPPAWGKTLLIFMWAILYRRLHPNEPRPLLCVIPLSAVSTNHIACLDAVIARCQLSSEADVPTYIVIDGDSDNVQSKANIEWLSYCFIFITPEQLDDENRTRNATAALFRNWLRRNIKLLLGLVIDEVHMALQWIAKFRTSFKSISKICATSALTVLAMSATLRVGALKTCQEWLLRRRDATVLNYMTARPDYQVIVASYTGDDIVDFEPIRAAVIAHRKMLVYAYSYPMLERLIEHLKSHAETKHIVDDDFLRAYTAALQAPDRDELLRLTLRGDVLRLLATVAASAGIDVDVDFVAVVGCTGPRESLMQMGGRLCRRADTQTTPQFYVCASPQHMTAAHKSAVDVEKDIDADKLLRAYFADQAHLIAVTKAFFKALADGLDPEQTCFQRLMFEPFGMQSHAPCTCQLRKVDATTSASSALDAVAAPIYAALVAARLQVIGTRDIAPSKFVPNVLLMAVARANAVARTPTLTVGLTGALEPSYIRSQLQAVADVANDLLSRQMNVI